MKTEIRETYRCDHCNKFYLRKSACLKHEEACFYNPENYRICYDCVHLTKKDVESIEEDDHGNLVKYSMFYCGQIDECLYPPSVGYKGNAKELMDYLNIPMRKECELHESSSLCDFFGMINLNK